jgi:hypothetical protein
MAFNSVRLLSKSLDEDGATWTSWIHKTGGPIGYTAGRWADCSMGAGTPKYNAYVGSQLVATVLTNSGNEGIYLGPTPQIGQTKHLSRLSLHSVAVTMAPAYFMLMDYLMFYPLVDGDDADLQVTDNTATLPRYDGTGVQCMVVVTSPMVSSATCTVTYTNSDGVSGRTTTFGLVAQTVNGVIVCQSDSTLGAGGSSPFIPLANGDKGIRSIESVLMNGATGGFMSFVLVRPLANIQLYENLTATEITQFTQRGDLPQIKDGAYLNFIINPAVTTTLVPLRGFLEFAWR